MVRTKEQLEEYFRQQEKIETEELRQVINFMIFLTEKYDLRGIDLLELEGMLPPEN
ncbi:hypothetical protein GQ472_01895 [archaeon]|nr:hypothetical protein [archaeon]